MPVKSASDGNNPDSRREPPPGSAVGNNLKESGRMIDLAKIASASMSPEVRAVLAAMERATGRLSGLLNPPPMFASALRLTQTPLPKLPKLPKIMELLQ
jgi:hypothetical protein